MWWEKERLKPLLNKTYKEYDHNDWLEEWNMLHITYIKEEMDGATESVSECGMFRVFTRKPEMTNYRNDKMADYLEEIMIMAKKEYYTTGEPIMDDPQYDKMEDVLKLLRPNSNVLKKVGYEIEKDI